MAYVFGISNHSPDQALSFLVRRKAIEDMSDVAIVPAGTRLRNGSKPVRNNLFIIDLADLYSNLALLNSNVYRSSRIFVFASALKLRSISGISPLDYEENSEVSSVAFKSFSDINHAAFSRVLKQPPTALHKAPVDYLQLLSSGVKTGSLLNPLMTFIYSLPSQSQTIVKEGVSDYISLGTISFNKMFSRFKQKLPVPLTDKQELRLRDIMETDLCHVFVEAFVKMRGRWDQADESYLIQMCKNKAISAYEMRYLRSVSSLHSNKDRKSIREMVLNGNG